MRIPEHRAAARIAWRQAWRAPGRTTLVLTLIALPVMGLAGAGFLIKTAYPTPEEKARGELGSADLRIEGYEVSLTTADIRRVLPSAARVASSKQLSTVRLMDGTFESFSVLEHSVPPDSAPVAAKYALLRGRAPVAQGEAAMSRAVMEKLDTGIGGVAVFEELGLRLTVVGEMVRREMLSDPLIVVAPGTIGNRPEEAPEYGWLLELPPGTTTEDAEQAASKEAKINEFMTREHLMDQRAIDNARQTGISFGFAAAALFGTGLIAAAAIGVGARRQLRTLGLVGAAGGEPRHVRAIVLWTGAVLGIVGSVVGIALAILGAYLAAPHIGGLVDRLVGPVRLPALMLAGGVALGAGAATVAAIGPARHAARLQTVDALAGRTPLPQPAGRLARRGLLATVGGSLFVGLAAAWANAELLALALIPTMGGFLLAIPLLVAGVGRASSSLPTALRLATRQTARYGRRTGTAVAAATLALAAPVALAAFTRSDEAYNNRRLPLAKNQMILGSADAFGNWADIPTEMLVAARSAVPGSVVGRIRNAIVPQPTRPRQGPFLPQELGSYVQGPSRPVLNEPGVSANDSGPLVIGDADLLRALNVEEAVPLLSSGKILAINLPVEGAKLQLSITPVEAAAPSAEIPYDDPRRQDRVVEAPAVAVGSSPPHASLYEGIAPRYVISEAGAARYGLRPGVGSSALLRSPRDLSTRDAERVKRAVSVFPGGHASSVRDYLFNSEPILLIITVAAGAIALVIVAVAVALVGAESRREHAILVAVGAEPGTRRRIVTANAFLAAALAGVLAAPAGFLPVAVVQFARRTGYPVIVPWIEMGIVVVGVPLVSAIVAGIFSREPSQRALLRPVW